MPLFFYFQNVSSVEVKYLYRMYNHLLDTEYLPQEDIDKLFPEMCPAYH